MKVRHAELIRRLLGVGRDLGLDQLPTELVSVVPCATSVAVGGVSHTFRKATQVLVFQRMYAGYWQRAAGAWSWLIRIEQWGGATFSERTGERAGGHCVGGRDLLASDFPAWDVVRAHRRGEVVLYHPPCEVAWELLIDPLQAERDRAKAKQ